MQPIIWEIFIHKWINPLAHSTLFHQLGLFRDAVEFLLNNIVVADSLFSLLNRSSCIIDFETIWSPKTCFFWGGVPFLKCDRCSSSVTVMLFSEGRFEGHLGRQFQSLRERWAYLGVPKLLETERTDAGAHWCLHWLVLFSGEDGNVHTGKKTHSTMSSAVVCQAGGLVFVSI